MSSQTASNSTESGSENKSWLDLMQENVKLNEKIVDLEKMYAFSEQDKEKIRNDWQKLRKQSIQLLEKERNTHIKYKKEAEKQISGLESEKSELQKDMEYYLNLYNDTMQKYHELDAEMDKIKTHLDEIVRVKNRAQNKQAQMQIEVELKNKELQDVVTKSDMIKFNDCFTEITWLLLDKGGIHYLVQLDEVLKSKNSISMVDTKMFQADEDKFALQFQEKSALQAEGYNTKRRISLEYDTAIQLFACMKDKFDASVDSSQKTQMQNMTDDNPLSHNFLLQMQQDRFECPVCFESNPSNVALCLNCNARLHFGCFPYDKRCPRCRHPLLTPDEDYTYLENHPEMRPAILRKPLVLIQNQDLRKRLKPLHNQAMHAQFGCTCGHGHCVG